MTKTEHPLKSMARFGWQPTLLTICLAMEGIVDTFFVAHIGISAIAAVTIATESIMVILWCFYAKVGTAVKHFTVTTKNKADALRIIIQGVYLSCALSLVLGGGTIILAKQLFEAYGVEITSDGVLYLQIVGGNCILLALFSVLSSGLQGWLKEQWSTTVAQISMMAIHLGLDYVLIYRFHFGLVGAACATLLASVIGTGWIIARFFRRAGTNLIWKPDWKLQKSILGQAFPQMLSSLSNQVSMIPIFAILARTGPEFLAAVRILYVIQRVFYLSWMGGIINSISLTIGPVIENKQQVAHYLRWAIGTVILGSILSWAVMLVMAEPAVGLLTDDTTVSKMAVWLILFYAFVQCPWTIHGCVGEVLGVHKQAKTSSIIYILSSVLLVIACWLLPPTLEGISYAEVIQYMFLGIVSTAYISGYFKSAGIELFPIRAAFERVLSFLRPHQDQVNEVIFTRDFTRNSSHEVWEKMMYRRFLKEVDEPQNLVPYSLEEMAPVFRTIRAYNALRLLDSAKRGSGENIPVKVPMENAEKFLSDALNTIATKKNLQSFLEFLTGAKWKQSQNTAGQFFTAFVQHAKANATTPTDIKGVVLQLRTVPSLRGEIVRDANVHAAVDLREALARIDQLSKVAA
jgi:Na+-driven multidrug efflux pump